MKSLDPEIGKELVREWRALDSLPPTERRQARRVIQNRYGLTTGTLYRTLHTNGWNSGRNERIDKGLTVWGEETKKLVAKILLETKRKDRRMIGNVGGIVDILEANGIIKPEEKVTPTTVRRYLRMMGLSKEQMMSELDGRAVFNHMRSTHPNHVHQFDITNCVKYYFEDGGIRNTNVIELYKIKNMKQVADRKVNILRFVLVDHFSGAFYVKYFETPGERAEDIVQFLWDAWREKKHPKYPFCGTPDILYMDAGPGNKSGLVKNLCRNLDIKPEWHEPGEPRAKGCVERMMRTWEESFESHLIIQQPTNIDELNEAALDYCIGYNGTRKHTRHGETRSRLWFFHQPEEIRKVPEWEVFSSFAHFTPVRRQVRGDGWIMFRPPWAKNQPWHEFRILRGNNIVPADLKGKTVHVQFSPWEYPKLDIIVNYETENEFHLLAEPVEKDIAGFAVSSPVFGQEDDEQVKRQYHSQSQNAMKELKEVEIPDMRAYGYHADMVRDNFIVPQGEVIGGKESGESVGEFGVKRMLRDAGVISHSLTEFENQHIKEELLKGRDQVPVSEVEAFIEAERRRKINFGGGK